MHSGFSALPKSIVGALGGLALSLALVPASASAADTSTVEPITTFTVTSGPNCAGGTQSQLVQRLQYEVQGQLGEHSSLPIPVVSLNPGCESPPPSELSSLISASNTESSSPSGSATISSEALGNSQLGEEAYGGVTLSTPIPLSSPASSVEVSIPFTTSGVTWSIPTGSDRAAALAFIDPTTGPIKCADGSNGTMAPNQFVTSFGTPTPPGSGTLGFRFSCPDGSDLVSGVGFIVTVTTDAYSGSDQTESASANFQMSGVTATIDS